MKSERTNEMPALNLLKNNGVQAQTDNKVITKVFLTNGHVYDVVPGSFHVYITAGDRPQPYIQFQANMFTTESRLNDEPVLHTVEIFPVSMAGVAFLTAEEEVRPPEMLG